MKLSGAMRKKTEFEGNEIGGVGVQLPLPIAVLKSLSREPQQQRRPSSEKKEDGLKGRRHRRGWSSVPHLIPSSLS